jgi:hypothetical protein
MPSILSNGTPTSEGTPSNTSTLRVVRMPLRVVILRSPVYEEVNRLIGGELVPDEVTQVMTATGKVGRHPMWEATLRLLMDHHGFWVAHAIA